MCTQQLRYHMLNKADANQTALDLVSSHIAIARAGPDHAEAIEAYRERRTGRYQGF